MEKIVKFYKVFAEPCLAFTKDDSNSEKIQKIFESLFDKPISDDFSYIYPKEKINFRFDIKEKHENYIFGTFCKEEHFEKDLLLQKRDSSNNSTGPYTPTPGEIIERFTYFLVDYKSAAMVAIHNQNLPRINGILPEFIWGTSNHRMQLTIVPYKIEDLAAHLKKYNRCKDLTLTFYNHTDTHGYTPLPAALNGSCEYDTYNIHFNIKSNEPSFLLKIPILKKDPNCKGITVSALNEYGYEDVINLMETVLTKKVGIELTTDMVFNTDQIKKTLLNELANGIKHTH